MPLRVLIAPDKFKGTLTALQATESIAAGWAMARPSDRLTLLPMSDGGDGFGEVMGGVLNAKRRRIRTTDAAGRRCDGVWWWDASSRTAVIESARIIGLAMLPRDTFHPFDLDTFGLGAVIRAAAESGAKRCLIGVGGSATNDGGFGLARALGWRFLDSAGGEILRWTDLARARDARPPRRRRWFAEWVVATDVSNPLLGPRGASRVYGPQKGLRPADMRPAESALRGLARAVARRTGRRCERAPGAGAAGGLGYGLMACFGARPTSGFELFSAHSGLCEAIANADLVVTGEGSLDRSSLMGKGVGGLAALARQLGVGVIALAGVIEKPRALARHFQAVAALVPDFATMEEARSKPGRCLAALAERVAARPAGWERHGRNP